MRRGFWFSLGISLSLHGAVGGLLAALLARPGSQADTPIAVDTVIYLDDEPISRNEQGPDLEPIIIPTPKVESRPDDGEGQAVAANVGTSTNGSNHGVAQQGRISSAAEGTSFFDLSTQALNVVYVIDRSSSMAHGGALERAKRELRSSLERLPANARFQVIVYNRRAEMCPSLVETMQPARAETIETVTRFVEQLTAEGSTDHGQALQRALTFQPDVVYFLTDSDDLTIEHVRRITQMNRGRATIHAIQFQLSPRDGSSTLALLAQNNQGRHQRVTSQGLMGN